MKKYILASLVLGISSVVVGLCPAVATADSVPTTHVTGYVYKGNNRFSVPGLMVGITCRDYTTGNTISYSKDTVDASGSYLVGFPAAQCPDSSHIQARAWDTNQLHWGRGIGYSRSLNSKLNLGLVDVGMYW
jgi:hypothetical protein